MFKDNELKEALKSLNATINGDGIEIGYGLDESHGDKLVEVRLFKDTVARRNFLTV